MSVSNRPKIGAPTVDSGGYMKKKFLNRKAVYEITGKSRSTIYRDIEDGTFPRPYKTGKRAIAWLESDILDWVDSRPVAGRRGG